MIYTWLADISKLTEEKCFKKFYELVPEERKRKADRLRFPLDRAQSVGAWILWEKMKSYYGWSGEETFNLSHSGKYVLCSASDREGEMVGCDIETVKEARMKVAERFFCPEEMAHIQKQDGDRNRADAFFRYWVLKESFMKAVRLGMKLDTRKFEIEFDKEDHPVLVKKPEEFPERFFYKEYQMDGVNAKMAVCSTSDQFAEIQVTELESEIPD